MPASGNDILGTRTVRFLRITRMSEFRSVQHNKTTTKKQFSCEKKVALSDRCGVSSLQLYLKCATQHFFSQDEEL